VPCISYRPDTSGGMAGQFRRKTVNHCVQGAVGWSPVADD